MAVFLADPTTAHGRYGRVRQLDGRLVNSRVLRPFSIR